MLTKNLRSYTKTQKKNKKKKRRNFLRTRKSGQRERWRRVHAEHKKQSCGAPSKRRQSSTRDRTAGRQTRSRIALDGSRRSLEKKQRKITIARQYNKNNQEAMKNERKSLRKNCGSFFVFLLRKPKQTKQNTKKNSNNKEKKIKGQQRKNAGFFNNRQLLSLK